MLHTEKCILAAYENGVLTVDVLGEIDHHSAKAVREEIDAELFLHRPRTLVMRLGNVDFMDSSGLGLILGRYALAKDIGCATVLEGPSHRVKKILDLAGMDRIIEIR